MLLSPHQVIITGAGQKVTLEQGAQAQRICLGRSARCQLQLTSPNLDDEHAVIESKGGRVYLTAKPGSNDPMAVVSLIPKPSLVFLNGSELRPAIAYLVPENAKVHFGSAQGEEVTVEFAEQGGNNPLLLQVMKSMASNDDVKKRLD